MDIRVYAKSIVDTDADTILIYAFEDSTQWETSVTLINDRLGNILFDLTQQGDFSGAVGNIAVLYPQGKLPAKRIIVVGLGSADNFQVDTLRRGAIAMQKAREIKAQRVASVLVASDRSGLSFAQAAQAIVEGALLGLYTYHGQRTSVIPDDLPETLEIALSEESHLQEAETGIARGRAFAAGTRLARDLVNLPPNICTPSYIAQKSQEMAKAAGLRFEVLEEKQMRALKMGALLGVAQGSDTPPCMIILEHNADKSQELDTVVLVGKSVTFDTGGYSIKSAEGMVTMKTDMGGGAAVIGAMRTIAGLNLPLHVVGLVPAADNMISGHSYRPQDVLVASNGKSIEVISTDAEGRLLLADALVYATRYGPSAVVDIATLTGACVTALGGVAAGLFGIDDSLIDVLINAGKATSEKVWHMPLFPEYEKSLESQTADLKNTGGRNSGVGASAAFLRHFVEYPAWAHIDMAGMASDAAGNPYLPKGATGYGSRLLAQFAELWAARKGVE